jgi:hypothetical protein
MTRHTARQAVRHVSVYIQVKTYPDVAVNVDSLMVVITVSITVAVTTSVTVINAISGTTAITVQAMAAIAIWHTTGDTTPIPELSATRQDLTFGW